MKSKTLLNRELPKLVKKPITRVQLAQYAGASGDFNRIHIDEEFAKNSPLNGVIAHGMLSMGFLGQYLDQIAGDDYLVENFKVRFRAMVRLGDIITCGAEVKNHDQRKNMLEVIAKNQKNEAVVLGEAILSARRENQ
jgi:acyl dehydratase